jgi:D-2-hydroxyacid dehydrogenase (NADP+)
MNRVRILAAVAAFVTTTSPSANGPFRVVVTGVTDAQLAVIRKAAPDVQVIAATAKDLSQKVADADALIGSCAREAVIAGKKLKWVQTHSAGVENCLYPEMADSPIVLTSSKILQGPEIADHAFALLLALTRGIRLAIPNQLQENWGRGTFTEMVGAGAGSGFLPIELRNKTALVIGVGGIGVQVAERAAAFGMKVMGVDPKDMPHSRDIEHVGQPEDLLDLLPKSDVVFMCAPYTRRTDGMMGTEQFAAMKKGSYFVAVSRGRTIKTDALVKALQSGHLAGAGLDVMDPEPLPKGHPLWKMTNVVITPHIAGRSDGEWDRRMDLITDNIQRFSKGLPLRHVIDKREGY